MQVFEINSLKDYSSVFINFTSNVILLKGSMGTGKTTFVKEFLKFKFNLQENELSEFGVMSPTFSIENHYSIKDQTVLHCDFYRVNEDDYDKEEFLESLEDFDWVFIEWSENLRLNEALTDKCIVEILKSDTEENSLNRKVAIS